MIEKIEKQLESLNETKNYLSIIDWQAQYFKVLY